MKRILLSGVAGAGLVLSSLAAAQDNGRDADSYHSGRDARYHDEHWRTHLFDDVKKDVQHVENVTWPGGGDQYRLQKTVDELNQLQGKLESHVYDERTLDDVIGVLSRAVNDNRMQFRERDMLSEDLSRLRQYRDRHADWDRDR
jgi:hypothetical protein